VTGQDQIIALRRRGFAPRYVWVSDRSTVRLSPQDVPEQQDWRFLVGLTAIVEGAQADRVARIAAAVQPIARRVIATTCPARDVTNITDTEALLTWPN
jgi:hypothetical protein